MWLFTRHGFYSVMHDKMDANHVQVRARIKDDLERLRAFAGGAGVKTPEVIVTPHAKSEVHGERDRDVAYGQVWSTMNTLQQQRRS